jgi:hypothetical protein
MPHLGFSIVLALFAAADASSTSDAGRTAVISEVALERRCFGCKDAGKVIFRADGSAERVDFGSARARTEEQRFRGTVERGEFDRLAATFAREGFFDLEDSYEHARIQDGTSTTTSAVLDGRRKSVLSRNQAGPPALANIEKAVAATAAGIDWSPAPDGD